VEVEPSARRYGRVFVGAPEHARGRLFRVGFVPGLAERVFPQKLRQDPLLLDEARATLGRGLDTMAARSARERLLLHLVVGACRERVHVSYPRLDVAESRARVPSFYALDVTRGVTGTIPDHRAFADIAARAGQSSLAWPAPPEPAQAIDRQEHDLAVVRRLLDASGEASVRGRAQYLLRLNAALRRSVVERWARGEASWSQYDGLVRVTEATRAALTAHRLVARPYSASALQRYAACPYQFLLGAIHRLHVVESLDAPQRMDPLTRGSLVHRVQAVTLRALHGAGLTPLTTAHLDDAQRILAASVETVAAEFHDRLAPPIERVWADEVASVARDLRGWLTRVADAQTPWRPEYVELGFGLPPHPDRDPKSVATPVVVAGKYALRGAIDVVDVHAETGRLRVTDHKTGKDRTGDALGIGGGRVLQPLLYAAVVKQVLGADVDETRLFFCTVDGGYRERPVPLTPATTRAAVEALEVIDRAVETGVLLPAPEDGACARCDFRPVCGPMAQHYQHHKAAGPLRDLQELRSRS
jgi:RecB family exonuclease